MTRDGPPAVLLGAGVNGLSVARSLGRAGVALHVLGATGSLVEHSRYRGNYVALAGGDGMQERWLEWLVGEGPHGAVVLPCGDDGLELVARNRPALIELGYRPIEADDRVLLDMLDKDRQYELAHEIGVPAPRTVTIRSHEDLELAATSFPYPCALKPLQSHVWARHFTGKVIVVGSAEELRRAFAQMQELGIDMLATEIIPGAEDQYYGYYSYIDERGEPLFHMTKRKIRQFPPRFGVGCYHVTNWEPDVAELGLRFMQGVAMRGLANVELKRDARDGQLKLIELNHRFTAINELVRLAGLDLALFVYNRLTGREGPSLATYRDGVRLWYPVEDLRAMRAAHRSGDLSLARALRSVLHRQHFPVFSLDDPKPSLMSNARLPRRAARKLMGRRTVSAAGSHPAVAAAEEQ